LADDGAIAEILDLALDDWLPIDAVLWIATSGERSDASNARVERILEQLFRDDLMVPGELRHGFEDWPGEADDWLARSRVELERLAWRPMGALFWLRLGSRGQAAARRGADDVLRRVGLRGRIRAAEPPGRQVVVSGTPPRLRRTDRASAVRRALALGPDLDGALDALASLPPSGRSGVIDTTTVRAALEAYRAGMISASLLERWAEVIHTREDIDIDPRDHDYIVQSLFELATPELFGPMPDVVSSLLERSDHVIDG
jgi:hypothetical protein